MGQKQLAEGIDSLIAKGIGVTLAAPVNEQAPCEPGAVSDRHIGATPIPGLSYACIVPCSRHLRLLRCSRRTTALASFGGPLWVVLRSSTIKPLACRLEGR